MRIPLGKVYRAFKELDQFDDQQCEWYIRRAKRKHLLSMLLAGIAAALSTLLVVGGLYLAEEWLMNLLSKARIVSSMRDGTSDWAMLVIMLGVLTPVIVGLIVGLSIRDAWLRWAIRKELVQSHCPKCDYQLLGLPVRAGVVRCPECGTDTKLDVEVPKSASGVAVAG